MNRMRERQTPRMQAMLADFIIGMAVAGVADDGVAEHGAVESDLVGPAAEWLGEEHACAISLECKARIACLHLLDVITIREYIANTGKWIDTKAPTFTPPMSTVAHLLCPGDVPVDMAEIAFVGAMMDEYALNGWVGVRMM